VNTGNPSAYERYYSEHSDQYSFEEVGKRDFLEGSVLTELLLVNDSVKQKLSVCMHQPKELYADSYRDHK
jgi:hypothetical protein